MISAAQLLDELMGRDRNLAPDEKRSNVRWDHESVSVAELGPPLSSQASLFSAVFACFGGWGWEEENAA